MGLSRTISKINGDFGRKSQIFPTVVYFAPPPEGVLLESVTGDGGKKYCNDGATGCRKKFDDFFRRVDTIDQRDRRTPGDSKDRADA